MKASTLSASLLALACLSLPLSALATEDGGNGATTTRADSGAAKQDEPEDDGCSASGARTDLAGSGTVALAGALGAGLVLARGRRRPR